MKGMVKLGYTADLQSRLNNINASTVVPKAFRIYASYEVEKEAGDKLLHSMIDSINPNLRIREVFDGKKREREFYTLSKEDAFRILRTIAIISGTEDKLKRYKSSDDIIVRNPQKSYYDEAVEEMKSESADTRTLFDDLVPSVSDYCEDDQTDEPVQEEAEPEHPIIEVVDTDTAGCAELPSCSKFDDEDKERCFENFEEKLLKRSSDKSSFKNALKEWYLESIRIEDKDILPCECCGRTGKRLFWIRNINTGNTLCLAERCIRNIEDKCGDIVDERIAWLNNCSYFASPGFFRWCDEYLEYGESCFCGRESLRIIDYLGLYYFGVLSEKEILRNIVCLYDKKHIEVWTKLDKDCSLEENATNLLMFIEKFEPFIHAIVKPCTLTLQYGNEGKDVFLFDSEAFVLKRKDKVRMIRKPSTAETLAKMRAENDKYFQNQNSLENVYEQWHGGFMSDKEMYKKFGGKEQFLSWRHQHDVKIAAGAW